MKKLWNLAKYLKWRKITLHIIAPITIVMLFILAIVFACNANLKQESLILFGLTLFALIMYIIGLTIINGYIKKLEKEETLKKEKLREQENREKMKDERIKELEEALKNAKTDS